MTAMVLKVPPNSGSQTAFRAACVRATCRSIPRIPRARNFCCCKRSCSTTTTLLSMRRPKTSTSPASVMILRDRSKNLKSARDGARATATLNNTMTVARTLFSIKRSTRVTRMSPIPPRSVKSFSSSRTSSVRSRTTSSLPPSGSAPCRSSMRSWTASATSII